MLCEPAYNAYTSDEVYRPSPKEIGGLRTASYHIHYGWEEEINVEVLKYFIFLNDVFLGFPAIYLDQSDILRKQVYGQLGEHRIKKTNTEYHNIKQNNRVEYRSLGAGMHNFPNFIENGINLIKKNIDNFKNIYDLYYEDFKKLSLDYNNEELKELIKQKLVKNGHYNR